MRLDLVRPIVCLITTGEATDANLADTTEKILTIIRVAIDEKVSLLQIREKKLSAKSLFNLSEAAARLVKGSATRLLVNDRADIALAAGADGVHLATDSLSVAVIRKSFPPEFIIGVSTHSISAAAEASRQGADFALFGPVFETPGKGKPRGIDELRDVCEQLHPFTVVGLGGIDESNSDDVFAAGASGIAAIRSLNNAVSLRSIARRLLHDPS